MPKNENKLQIAETGHDMKVRNSEKIDMEVLGLSLFPFNETCCRYVGMISPDITISNHRLRWAVDGMRFTAPLLEKFTGVESLLGKLHRNENHDESAN